LVVPVLGFVAGSALRAKLGPRLVPLADGFRDMVKLLVVAGRLAAADDLPDRWRRDVKVRLSSLARLRRFGASLGRDAAVNADLVGLMVEYLNLLFCLDANAVMLGVRELRRRQDDLHAVFVAVGSLDAALAVASLRDSGVPWTRPAFTAASAPLAFDGLRHPLLEHPVPNSLALGPPAGLLVTGANMTGKSTFLRTVGVNVVLAQSIDTVLAASYRAPWLSVASCITAGDDLQAGKSSYQAEVETLVAMLRRMAEGGGGDHLFLFDELFRGTNTIDRIGAAAAVLGWMTERSRGTGVPPVGAPRCLVIAATHDLELVSLLAGRLEPVHFADRLGDSGLEFDYTLRPGPTTTRNAIALLGVLGAPPEVVREALARSDALRARQ
jgi:DNA mismatch repair ATPase MutS